MSTTAIVLLVIGVLFFAASFFLPDGKKNENPQIVNEELIKELVDREVKGAKERIEDIVDETVTYSVEKTERQLEKISNEKIMAVDEYSETVLKRINDNHKEAVFLYDMLNDKGEQLKTSGEDLKAELKEKDALIKEKDKELLVKEEVLKAKEEDLNSIREEIKAEVLKEKNEEIPFVPFIPERVEIINPIPEPVNEEIPAEVPPKKETKRTVKKPVTGKGPKIPEITPKPQEEKPRLHKDEPEVTINFSRDNESRKNNNELIRKMHEEGKSNMAIAKELGLGVGEVKLVIDLYSNKK